MSDTSRPPRASRLRSLKPLGRVLARVRDLFPLTTLGVALAAIGALAYWVLAHDSADFVLLAIGITAMALVGLSLLSLLLAAPLFALSLRRKEASVPEQLNTGIDVETGFQSAGFRYWPILMVRWGWRSPEGVRVELVRRDGQLREVITPTERGRYEAITRRFVIRDVFGFVQIAFSWTWAAPIRIAPVPGRANIELAIRRATDDGYSHPAGQPLGELVEMRRYQAGDPVRHIIWKAFARSRRLMVREAERAIAPKPAMVGYFVAGPDDEPSASTARLFLEEGLLGSDFVFTAAGARGPTSSPTEAIEQIITSRSHRDKGADGLGALLRSVDRGRLDNLIIFAPASSGPWVDRLIEQTRRLPRPPTVILTFDGPATAPAAPSRASRVRNALFTGDTERRRALSGIAEAHERLRRAGAEVKILHRGSGSRLDAVTLDAWRAAA